jgi:hypothetical protein
MVDLPQLYIKGNLLGNPKPYLYLLGNYPVRKIITVLPLREKGKALPLPFRKLPSRKIVTRYKYLYL